MRWDEISTEEKVALAVSKYTGIATIEELAKRVGMNPITLNRRLVDVARDLTESTGNDNWKTTQVVGTPSEVIRLAPANEELFRLLRKAPQTMTALCDRFDRAPGTIREWLAAMEAVGYVVEESQYGVSVPDRVPQGLVTAPTTLADDYGEEISFAVISDTHQGNKHAQTTSLHRFIDIAYGEYGIRTVFHAGDWSDGVFVYPGHELDLVPGTQPPGRQAAHVTSNYQVEMLEYGIPKKDGLVYYGIGGNHDYTHIKRSGIDVLAALSKRRPDIVHLGYDVADIPLTDRASVRLIHPKGGVPYSVSYRAQKVMEQSAFDELQKAAVENRVPNLRFLFLGHLHVEATLSRGTVTAAQVGCFEGQTNLLKQLALFPSIGGAIFHVRLTGDGLVQRCRYEFIHFDEVENDWTYHPVPSQEEFVPDTVEPLFTLRG